MATTKATTLAHTLGGISSDISTAEINRLDGVTDDLQTQLDAKAPIASPTFTGTANISSGATFPSNPTITLGSNASINTQDYFHVKLSSPQTISDSAWTAIAFANESTEGGDPNNWFNTTTYKFQPTKAGKYHVSLSIGAYSHSTYYLRILNVRVKKNSTALDDTNEIFQIKFDARDSSSSTQYWYSLGGTGSALVNMNGSSDYIYCIAYGNIGSGSGVVLEENITHFSGFRIGS